MSKAAKEGVIKGWGIGKRFSKKEESNVSLYMDLFLERKLKKRPTNQLVNISTKL